jgi:hypothetical protein
MYSKGILMRRLLSLVLLLAFGLPVVAPALGQTADDASSLPACCRRNGAHHCSMKMQQRQTLQHGRQVVEVSAKCPCCPGTAASLHHELLAFTDAPTVTSARLTQPARLRQTEAWARIALAGARHKRGPPSVRLS